MGVAVAAAAVRRGHDVVLIAGPMNVPPPDQARCVRVTTAQEMLAAVERELHASDALIMTAAVADFRPKQVSEHKLHKQEMPARLELERNPDILATVAARKGDRLFVGFAAETQDIVENARRKLAAKRLDLIVANDVSRPDSGFGTDTNRVIFLAADTEPEHLPLLSKKQVAERILDWIEQRATRARG